MDYVLSTGPISVCLDAMNWHTYQSGVLSICGRTIDHCVQAVGVDIVSNVWKIRNSWLSDWGEQGHIYLKAGVDMCGITYNPTYVSVKAVEV